MSKAGDMHKPKGRVTGIVSGPPDKAGRPHAVLMLDRLTHIPEAGDVLNLAGRTLVIVQAAKQQSRHCLTWRKLAGLGRIGVMVDETAEELAQFAQQPNQLWVTWTPKGEPPWHFNSKDLPTFTQLNEDWNAEPIAVGLKIEETGNSLLVRMRPNPYLHSQYKGIEEISVSFEGCSKYRVTPINDQAWYSGQCRFSGLAPAWGEFYEISGDTRDEMDPTLWIQMDGAGTRHFHFYLRDEALEVKAQDWSMQPNG